MNLDVFVVYLLFDDNIKLSQGLAFQHCLKVFEAIYYMNWSTSFVERSVSPSFNLLVAITISLSGRHVWIGTILISKETSSTNGQPFVIIIIIQD